MIEQVTKAVEFVFLFTLLAGWPYYMQLSFPRRMSAFTRPPYSVR